jgi:putative hemolysin
MNTLDPDSSGYLLLAIASLLLLGISACGERALGNLSRARIQHLAAEHAPRVQDLDDFVDRPERYESALDIGQTLATLCLALATALLVLRYGPTADLLVLAFFGALLAALIAGPALSRLALARPEETAIALALPIRGIRVALSPLTAVVARLGAQLGVPAADDEATGELLDRIEERQVVMKGERDMIDGIFELEETAVREIMVPRMDVVALAADAPLPEALDVIIREGYSRLPIFGRSIDDIVGILYAKDLFPLVRTDRLDGQVGSLVRPAYFIPQSKKVGELLRELQRRKVHIAVVVDEYGGTAGIVTIEDLLEEIVGEIQDEYDSEEAKIVAGSDGEAVFDATVSIDDVNDTLGVHLAGEEVDTIGGLVYELLGRLPQVGDRMDAPGATITVVATSGRRIKRVRVVREDPVLADGTAGVATA